MNQLLPMSRRAFQRLLAGGAVAALWRPAAGAAEPLPGMVYVGTDGTGLRALRFDARTGELAPLGVVADVPKPRWVVAHPQLPRLYVAIDGGAGEGRVAAYARDLRTGVLTPLNEAGAGGAGTTHLTLDATSMTLLAANFGAGSVSSIAVNADGSLGTRVATVQAIGSGPHRRQASPHAHGTAVDPSGRHALVADLGADRVFVHGFDRASRALQADDAVPPRSFAAPAGSGPRRAVFGADGRHVYVLCELTAEIMVLRWEASTGRLAAVQALAMSGPGFAGARSASELMVSRDGRFVYAANRAEHELQVYGVDPQDGTLALLQRLPSGGEAPWAFDIHASGRWLLVAHHRSGQVNLFRIDPATGRLADTGQAQTSPSPVGVAFVD